MRHIIQSSETKAALREIHAYTANHWDMAQAAKYHLQFKATFNKLAKNPALGHMNPEMPEDYRIYPIGSHWVVYRANARELFVIAIVHHAMDIESRIKTLTKKYH